MSKLNNPAGRLHELLVGFRDLSSASSTINATWCNVLDVDEHALLPTLGQVASLLDDVRAAVKRSSHSELKELYDEFSPKWAVPIFTHGRNPASDKSTGLVDLPALLALGSLSVNFERLDPDGVIPDEETETQVRAAFDEVLSQLARDTELPADLRAVIAARIHDISWAMDHVQIVGPDGVEAAVERLVGQLAIFTVPNPDLRKTGLFQQTMRAAERAWAVFRSPGDVHQALEGWQQAVELLPPM